MANLKIKMKRDADGWKARAVNVTMWDDCLIIRQKDGADDVEHCIVVPRSHAEAFARLVLREVSGG